MTKATLILISLCFICFAFLPSLKRTKKTESSRSLLPAEKQSPKKNPLHPPERTPSAGIETDTSGKFIFRLLYGKGKDFPTSEIVVSAKDKKQVIHRTNHVFQSPWKVITISPIKKNPPFQSKKVHLKKGLNEIMIRPFYPLDLKVKGLRPGRTASVLVMEDSKDLQKSYSFLFNKTFKPRTDKRVKAFLKLEGEPMPFQRRILLPFTPNPQLVRIVVLGEKSLWRVIPTHEDWGLVIKKGKKTIETGGNKRGTCPLSQALKLSILHPPTVTVLFKKPAQLLITRLKEDSQWRVSIRRIRKPTEERGHLKLEILDSKTIGPKEPKWLISVPPGELLVTAISRRKGTNLNRRYQKLILDLLAWPFTLKSGERKVLELSPAQAAFSCFLDESRHDFHGDSEGIIQVTSNKDFFGFSAGWLLNYKRGGLVEIHSPFRSLRLKWWTQNTKPLNVDCLKKRLYTLTRQESWK